MRVNFRIKKFGITFFAMLSNSQTLEGVTSLQKDGKHIILFDSKDNCSLELLKEKFREIQNKYGLSDIGIFSDKEGSYRVWCFTKVDFVTFLRILLDAYDFMDWNFFWWTVKRGKATLRADRKKNRPAQKIVAFLSSYSVPIPEVCEKVVYDTGIQKRGMSIILGESGKIIRGNRIG